jgi:molybdopterin synthase catalytic subunit
MRSAIVRGPIEPTNLLDEVQGARNGAAVLFVGTVREVNDGRLVTGMEYAAYEAMAENELRRIAEEATSRFGSEDLVVVHRLGVLEVGEASVAIAAAHPHRAQAIEACRYVIEELKRRVPIWKLEHYADGTREWVDPSSSSSGVATPAGGP